MIFPILWLKHIFEGQVLAWKTPTIFNGRQVLASVGKCWQVCVGKCWRGRSNSNSPSPITTMVGHYPTKCLVRQHKANTKGFSRPSKTQGIPKFNLEENTKCGILASPALRKKNERMERGGTNRSDIGLNLSGSWQQGHSATYNTPSRI